MSKNTNDLEYDIILDKIDSISNSKLGFTQELSYWKSLKMAADLDLKQATMDYIFGKTDESPFEEENIDHQRKMDDYDNIIDTLTEKAQKKLKRKVINK